MKRIIRWITKKMLKSVGITIFEENGIRFMYVDGDIHVKGGVWADVKSVEEATKVYYKEVKVFNNNTEAVRNVSCGQKFDGKED